MNKNEKNQQAAFDLIIIGGGPAGYEAAVAAGAAGIRTALVEKDALGGTCLNRGCIPTKTMLHTAELYAGLQTAGELGIETDGGSVNMEKLAAHRDGITETLRKGVAMLMKKNKVTVLTGTGKVLDPHHVEVTEKASVDCIETVPEPYPVEATTMRTLSETLSGTVPDPAEVTETAAVVCGEAALDPGQVETAAKGEIGKIREVYETRYILAAAGSRPSRLPVSGMDLPGVMTSDDILKSARLYQSLTIVGGGVIGMEFASVYSALGCKVTVIEFLDKILANMDKEISQNLKMILKKRGVEIHTGAALKEIRQLDGSLVCSYEEKGAMQEISSEAVLVATGRRPCTEDLFAEACTPKMERGHIPTDEFGRTDIPGIYAAGDITCGIQLAHAASAEAKNAVAHIATCLEKDVQTPLYNLTAIPACVYTSPEIATVGMTQEEAKTKGIAVTVKKYPMSANGKSLVTGQERGFIKVVAEAESHKILGAQLMCGRATDLIGEFCEAVVNGLTLEQMAAAVHPHPTFCEGIGETVRL